VGETLLKEYLEKILRNGQPVEVGMLIDYLEKRFQDGKDVEDGILKVYLEDKLQNGPDLEVGALQNYLERRIQNAQFVGKVLKVVLGRRVHKLRSQLSPRVQHRTQQRLMSHRASTNEPERVNCEAHLPTIVAIDKDEKSDDLTIHLRFAHSEKIERFDKATAYKYWPYSMLQFYEMHL
jgi:hypothetical protein